MDECCIASRAAVMREILLICEREARVWHSKGSIRSAAKVRALMSMIAMSVGPDGAHIEAEVKRLPSQPRSKYALKRALRFIDNLADEIPGAHRHATRIRIALRKIDEEQTAPPYADPLTPGTAREPTNQT